MKIKSIRKTLNRILKNLLLPATSSDGRTSPSTKLLLRQLWHYYQDRAIQGIPLDLENTGARIFSQFEEDGILLAIFASIGTKTKTFVDIGAADGINSNCANLALNFGWHGLFIDGNSDNITRGRDYYENHPDSNLYPPKFVQAKVTRENINQILLDADVSGTIDLLSIDIDGNDYWIWDALSSIDPTVVIIETHSEFGMNPVVVPYDPEYSYPPKLHPEYFGASPVAMVTLGEKKGYRLAGSNQYGFNFIFIKNGIGEEIIPAKSVEKIISHPRNQERMILVEDIQDFEYVHI